MLWIGIQLLIPEDEGGPDIQSADHLLGAIRTIIVADFVMSLDNVIGVAAAAKGNVYLLGFGLVVSIPLIVWSSQLILKLMERYPVVVIGGAGLLGWVAGEMMISDPALGSWAAVQWPSVHYLAPALGTLVVVVTGKWIERRHAARRDLTII